MSLEELFPVLGAEFKGALAGGIVAVVLDNGSIWHRAFNGIGSIAIAVVITPGVVDILARLWIQPTQGIVTLVAAILALVGLILAEFVQRVARRLLFRSNDVADKLIDRTGLPKGKDKK